MGGWSWGSSACRARSRGTWTSDVLTFVNDNVGRPRRVYVDDHDHDHVHVNVHVDVHVNVCVDVDVHVNACADVNVHVNDALPASPGGAPPYHGGAPTREGCVRCHHGGTPPARGRDAFL